MKDNPLSPWILVSALQDKVHKDGGLIRSVRVVKRPKK